MTMDAVERVREALVGAGHPDTIVQFPEGTRTAADAAAAVGCEVAQIAKSIVFRGVVRGVSPIAGPGEGERAVVVVTSGANRVDKARAGAAAGLKLLPAGPDFVLAATGFAAGGVSPVGLAGAPVVLLDEDLLRLDPIWAAAGSPSHVFRTDAASLLRMAGAVVAAVRQGTD